MWTINSCNGFCDFVFYGSGVRARRRVSYSEKLPAEAAFWRWWWWWWWCDTFPPIISSRPGLRQWWWCQRGVCTEGGDKKWVTQIVSHRRFKQGSTIEGLPPSCSLLLSVFAVPSCSVRLDSAGRFSLNASKTRKKKTKKKKISVFYFFNSPSVLRSTLPHSGPPESCCLLSACCSSAAALPPPPQMASVPRGTPGLGEGREADEKRGERKKKTRRGIKIRKIHKKTRKTSMLMCESALKY